MLWYVLKSSTTPLSRKNFTKSTCPCRAATPMAPASAPLSSRATARWPRALQEVKGVQELTGNDLSSQMLYKERKRKKDSKIYS